MLLPLLLTGGSLQLIRASAEAVPVGSHDEPLELLTPDRLHVELVL